jgi:signal transduction histidine kinase/PAS domain-containing protein
MFPALPCDPRVWTQVADQATSAAPAWLWRADGTAILWANAAGAAVFGVQPAASGARRFDPNHPATREIVRLAATLPPAPHVRLERLRGFGGGFGRAVTCSCWRVAADEGAAIFVVAAEPLGPPLALRERVSRLIADSGKPFLVFTPDGKLLYATPAAQAQFAAITSATALGRALFDQALSTGSARGGTPHGRVAIERLGTDASAVLIADLDAQPGGVLGGETGSANENTRAPSVPAVQGATLETSAAASFRRDELAAERRHPLRFVWQMDTEGRFVVGSDEFMELMGPRTTAAFGRLWREIAADLKLDPDGQIARAVATRETWSGISVPWPVDDGGERLPVELSGLPVFDRDRQFRGYRGFGVCRELDRINRLARVRRERPIGFMAPPVVARDEADASADDAEGAAVAASAATAPQTGATASEPPPASTPMAAHAERSARADAAALNVGSAANVVRFPTSTPSEPKAPALSPVERKAFRELAQELTARLQGAREDLIEQEPAAVPADGALAANPPAPAAAQMRPHETSHPGDAPSVASFAPVLLGGLPFGILIYRRADAGEELLYANRYLLELSGCEDLEALAARGGLHKIFAEPLADALAEGGSPQALSVVGSDGRHRPVEGRLVRLPWGDGGALALVLSNGEAAERRRSHALSLESAQSEIRELKAHVEAFKKTEAEMRAATREAQKAAAAKAEFVAKISHEIRTPLNAITGFAEVIMSERLGPIGNERYREYLKDMHAAGLHVVALLNDLLDLSKIETGQLDLSFANVSLNELTQQCVGIMQPQASRARIIIRTSLTPGLPQVVADERSLRQIVLNLLSNSIKFTGPGGQVIVSTAFADSGEAILRVRDTGVGMSEKDVEAALEPFRQAATSGSWGSGGTGLGLPLTKALAEANRAHFSIKSAPNAGTLIEVAFPPTRIAR